jgi:hypothetical protein
MVTVPLFAPGHTGPAGDAVIVPAEGGASITTDLKVVWAQGDVP